MAENFEVWRRRDLAKMFLEDIRGAIPLAVEQIDVMLRVIRAGLPSVGRVLDLGCGDGILGRSILDDYAGASCVFVDFSEAMIEAAKRQVSAGRATFLVADYSRREWTGLVAAGAPFDLVVSGFSIHHQPDARKREIYQEVYSLLANGGMLLNLESVAMAADWQTRASRELLIDSVWAYHRERGGQKSREQILAEFEARPSRDADRLAPLSVQCRWLEEIGFVEVDCHFKLLQIALFGGRKLEQ